MKATDIVKDNKKLFLPMIALLVVVLIMAYTMSSGIYNIGDSLDTTGKYSSPSQVLEEGVDYKALMKTNLGDITIDLFEEQVPISVNSFLFLSNESFYNGIIFHRVYEDLFIQTGDPTGNGNGGPGYTIEPEISVNDLYPYCVAYASDVNGQNGSQFFIVSGDAKSSDFEEGQYTIFGEVIQGKAVVDSIEKVEVNDNYKPINSITIESIQILE